MSDPDRQIWLDGEFVPWGDATVHLLSHSVQRGSLVFDYMSVHSRPAKPATAEMPLGAGSVFRLELHMERFARSCEIVGLELEHSTEALCEAVLETVRRNPGARAVKASAYLAAVEVDVVPQDDHVTVAIAAYDPVGDIIKRNAGTPPPRRETIRLWVEKVQKNRREDIMPAEAKVSANYASPMVAKARARKNGYDEIVLVDEDGHVAEGPTTNLFLVDKDGTLVTPPPGHVLLGVTRRSILELAVAEGIPTAERDFTPEELMRAPEVFLTGTTAGVLPVVSVDDAKIGDGTIGPISQQLRERFKRVVSGEDPEFEHWLAPA